ncbi:ATPase family various cellular activities (AAA), partial [Rhizoctonia solani]
MPIIRRGQDITARSYYECFDQVWDPQAYGNWVIVPVDGQIRFHRRNLAFEAHNRIHSPTGSSVNDHTWIEIESNDLVKYFRSHEALKGVESLENVNPGIDARDIYLRLEALKVSAVEPIFELEEEEPATVGLGLGWPPSPVPMLPINFATHSQDQFPSPPRSIVSPPGITYPPPMNSSPSSRNSYSPVFLHSNPPLTVPEQLWVLLDFIESHFKETIEELERLRSGGDISYNLLWTLCIPGHLVETKDTATGLPIGMRLQSWDYGHDGTKFTIWGDTYMWDGKLFKREITSVEIEHFKGIMKLDELPIKPLTDQCKLSLIGSYAYTLSCSTRIDKHGFCVERGRLYQKYAGIHHLNYDAAITVSTEYSTIQLPAKGRVMLDAGGYSRYNSNNSREHQGPTWDPYPLRSPLPGPVRSPLRSDDEYKNDNPLPDEILCLTPPAHKAWSFAAEAWGDVLVNNLSEITFDKLALDQLVLKTDQKKLLKALVESHSGGNKLAMDARPGKNGGLMMVLHGNPGAKKTLTAEAVSEHLKCPLYVVSSGELGTEADELEKKLRSIFEMIAAWGAALLINEANLIATLYGTL